MILINRLAITPYGWSSEFQERMERGMKMVMDEKGYKFYPDYTIWEEDVAEEFTLIQMLQSTGNDSMCWLELNEDIVNEAESIYFMDSMQNVSGQLLTINNSHIDYEVYVHLSKDYSGYVENAYYYWYNQHFASIMGGCDNVGVSYFGDKRNSRFRNVGGIVNQYIPHIKEDWCIWAGYDWRNPAKGWDKFVEIVKRNPDIMFKAFIKDNEIIDKLRLSNLDTYYPHYSEDYIEELKKAKWVLSTSHVESFGYCVFDGISVGCIPLARPVGSYYQYLPKRFLYIDNPNFNVDYNDEMLRSIIEPFYPERFCKRLITGATL
jgi:hypothetical protein